ncbi:DUF4148 domain-containing protein [Paraburkholderia pallida]|uniref:DUF4148 domain-containing protein n=1 Tax=Paraburkholderia pallida TaxID=2547399 RepID=A0A4P7DCQ6_9BURK|nr:DUF4148 domain-containing protein [Paraburkholderia pallida]QBR04472.1 DUF4148 domain-containing protein [Paraburkholderia pallida]
MPPRSEGRPSWTAYAQTTTPLTHAQVRAQLVQLESSGYTPARRNDATYPADIQAAEERVQARESAGTLVASGMGSGTGSTSQAGGHDSAYRGTSKLFEHH